MIKICVTQEHINRGRRKSAASCPVAEALRDVFPVRYIYVWRDGIEISRIGLNWENHNTTPAIKKFIEDFDAGRPVQPFEFVLP